MGVAGLFNQTITLSAKTGYNKDGREIVGQVTRIDLIVYMKPDVTVEIDYKITYSGKNYKVFGKSLAVDGKGATNHIKLECIEWKET
jgi:hypothetical protein